MSQQRSNDEDKVQSPLQGRRQRTVSSLASVTSPNAPSFQLFKHSQLYATPWDADNPEEGHQTLRPPLLPPKDERVVEDEDEQPLLGSRKSSFLLSPDARQTRFTASFSGDAIARDRDAIDDFGSVPNSANSRTEFLPPPRVRTAVRDKGSSTIWLPPRHPYFPNDFEAVDPVPIVKLLVIILLAYPIMFIATLLAQNRPIFWTRFIVGTTAAVLGFALGMELLNIGKRLLEATTWATIVHRSMYEGRTGITLADLETKSTYHYWTWRGISMLVERMLQKSTRRRNRPYDKRPWSLYVVFFIFISLLAASISFLLGRLIDITTKESWQGRTYKESTVVGDLSEEDIAAAHVHLAAQESFIQTWTLSPFGSGRQVPQPVVLQYNGQEDVYFSEVSNEFIRGGNGYGTFKMDETGNNGKIDTTVPSGDLSGYVVGSVVRYSRWGLRIQCTKLPNPTTNIVPLSPANITYAYVPQDTIMGLITTLGFQDVTWSWNSTSPPFLQGNDTVPDGIDMDQIGFVGYWWNNGVAHQFRSRPIENGNKGWGWLELEVIMIRLNTTYTPGGSFGTYSTDKSIGYDAAVCVEAIEPYVVDAYNSTSGRAGSIRIVGKGDVLRGGLNNGERSGHTLDGFDAVLNSTKKFEPFAAGHENSRGQIIKDNGRDFWWVPNPTVISWTGNSGPNNYTSLSVKDLQTSLGRADAAQMLPYLIGSKKVLGFRYDNEILAKATIFAGPTVATLGVIVFVGLLAAFSVPRLPLGIPRRDFSIFTWLAAFEGDDLVHNVVKQGVDRNMDLDELHRRYGSYKIRYGA
ncbi:SubName: Full=Uncharacterized protein {ECO:0000313/EMBL:CCA71241.1} [Serendipita indica DSM 11827]|uniref:Uncharacterized protein n=1 Tax=Serendipita indica (strain DSM 11827) TaxID=1109443 RepID=G4TIU9_SERID|nr:SubName: Full=Uncharacterized protein {ECO:0000313/EMBL:CCA71241.1} [Serendipita indica DSM 11827]CCA71241.1 hypothetical protein PIIN_05179 [Serendipita indica DSM 11827]